MLVPTGLHKDWLRLTPFHQSAAIAAFIRAMRAQALLVPIQQKYHGNPQDIQGFGALVISD